MRYFSLEERMFIEKSLKAGLSTRQIAIELNRHVNSVFNEIKKRRTKDGYFGQVAHADYEEGTKRRFLHMLKIFSDEEKKYIRERYDAGITIACIATELATTDIKISCFLRQNNLKRKGQEKGIGVIERLVALEEQIKILSEIVKKLKNDSKNKKLPNV